MLARLIAWLLRPLPCPLCGHALKSDSEGSYRMNPERDARGYPLPGAGLCSRGFRCNGCGALLAEVRRVGGGTTWEDRSVRPWRRITPRP